MAILEPFIRANAERLIGAMLAGDQPAEFVHAVAFPLPAYTVFRHIGFPDDDAYTLKRWCGNRKLFQWGRATEAEQVAIAENMVAYWHYCQAFTDAKLDDLADDFASDLLRAHLEDPTQLTLDEVKSVVYGLSFAGHEAVTNLLCNTVRQLLSHRDQWEAVCADPDLVTAAVEEVLRYDSSQISWRRIARSRRWSAGSRSPRGPRCSCCSRPPTATLAASTIRTPSTSTAPTPAATSASARASTSAWAGTARGRPGSCSTRSCTWRRRSAWPTARTSASSPTSPSAARSSSGSTGRLSALDVAWCRG
jgi:hypothetical protein